MADEDIAAVEAALSKFLAMSTSLRMAGQSPEARKDFAVTMRVATRELVDAIAVALAKKSR